MFTFLTKAETDPNFDVYLIFLSFFSFSWKENYELILVSKWVIDIVFHNKHQKYTFQ
mgnify:CR=1 FL=1